MFERELGFGGNLEVEIARRVVGSGLCARGAVLDEARIVVGSFISGDLVPGLRWFFSSRRERALAEDFTSEFGARVGQGASGVPDERRLALDEGQIVAVG